MQSAKDMGKVLVFEREPSRFIEIRDQQQVLTDFEAIAYVKIMLFVNIFNYL